MQARDPIRAIGHPTPVTRGRGPYRVWGKVTPVMRGRDPGYWTCHAGRAERNPPMGVVKRGLWAWRLFHFLMRRSRDVCGDAQRAHLPQCSATQASRTNTHQQKVFALQSPRNPKRATRSGVEEKNGISAEGRAKRVMPDFFFHSATRCAT